MFDLKNRWSSIRFQLRQWWGECLHEATFEYWPPPAIECDCGAARSRHPEAECFCEGPEWVVGPRWKVRTLAVWVGVRSITWPLWHPVARWACRRWGHNIEDNGSYAGPDSGADHMVCVRCDEHFSHIYY